MTACLLFASGAAAQLAYAAPPEMPAAARPFAPRLVPWGEGRLTWFGVAVYQARLWAAPDFSPSDWTRHDFVLELTYARALRGADIARRSIEEMRRAGELSAEQAARWESALRGVLPDVAPGDRIAGVHRRGVGLSFSVNDRAGPLLDDPELARLFFSIWLAPTTSEPGLRAALLRRPNP